MPGSKQHQQLFPSDVSKINVVLFHPRDRAELLPAPRLEWVSALPGALPAHDSQQPWKEAVLVVRQSFRHAEMPQLFQTFQRNPRPSETLLLLFQLSWNNLL